MLVEGSLAREFLIKHELARILRIKMEFVNETPGFLASGSDERMQLRSRAPFRDLVPLESER